jgi:cell fate regulator YaaT (PSP1 superfamily)
VSQVIEVAFKGNRKEFFVWERDEAPPLKAAVVVEADRGEDLGRVHATGELALKRAAACSHGTGSAPPARKALRLAGGDDVRRVAELREQDEVARRRAMERVKANNLVMKLTDAEWQWDRKKLTFYFTAEKRVDFRTLVRDLAAMFRTRIELKQIGVRDEARRLDGIGRCGRQYCSASWLPELRPVNLGVAKDQRLSLNPSQISGACGRLMCCLRYEHEFYVQSRKRFPKEGKTLVTARGEEKVVANDIFGDRVTLRGGDGETRVLPLADLKRELVALGLEDPTPAPAVTVPLRRARDERRSGEEPPEEEDAIDAIGDAEGEDEEDGAAPLDHDGESARASAAGDGAGAERDRRPHRRRGRRGGRRGKTGGATGSGDGGPSAPSGAGQPPRGAPRPE